MQAIPELQTPNTQGTLTWEGSLEPLRDASVKAGVRFGSVDLSGITDKRSLLRKLATALHFPDYFGNNWDAVDEVLNDPDWFGPKPRTIVFLGTESLPSILVEEVETLRDVLSDAADAWAEQQVAFWPIFAI